MPNLKKTLNQFASATLPAGSPCMAKKLDVCKSTQDSGIAAGQRRRAAVQCFLTALVLCLASAAGAGGVALTNVNLLGDRPEAMFLQCDIAWSNSWRSPADELGNWDAAWIFAKARLPGQAWQAVGFQKDGHSGPAEAAIEAPADGAGVFVSRQQEGWGSVSFAGLKLHIRPTDNQINALDKLEWRLLAIEMVYVPAGAYLLGSGGAEESACYSHPDKETPFRVTSEAALPLGAKSGSLHIPGAAGDTIPAAWPKGVAAFYGMKYELSQGQYADFLNMLPAQQAKARFPNQNGRNRQAIAAEGADYVSAAPERACNFLSWADGAAYADWAGLRPMTEFEFEKACRGIELAAPGEYAWGNNDLARQPYTLTVARPAATPTLMEEVPDGLSDLMDDVGGAEIKVPAPAKKPAKPKLPTETLAAFPLTGNALCAATRGTIDGPLAGDAYRSFPQFLLRDELGCSYYGLMEMSGNLWEPCVTLATRAGFAFTGSHGDGTLSATGQANNPDWPGYDPTHQEVKGAQGTGLRGGSWQTSPEQIRISDREAAARPVAERLDDVGWRSVRSAP